MLNEYEIKTKVLNKVKIYIKDGEEISKFLALIGANSSVLRFEEIRVLSDRIKEIEAQIAKIMK